MPVKEQRGFKEEAHKSRVDKKVKVKVTGSVKNNDLHKMIKETAGSSIYTDENLSCAGLNKKGYNHERVNHGVGEYIKERAYTNGVENFWSILKRGLMGVYHKMSRKQLQRYIDEYAGRHKQRITYVGPDRKSY